MLRIKIQEDEFKDFKDHIDERLNDVKRQLDIGRRQFLEGFISSKESFESIEGEDRKRTEDIYYVVLFSLIKDPTLIPMMSQAELDRLNVRTFGDYMNVIRTWARESKKSKKFSERLVNSYARTPKLLLYPIFVITLVGLFWHVLEGYQLYQLGINFGTIIANEFIAIFYLLGAWYSGRGIYRKLRINNYINK